MSTQRARSGGRSGEHPIGVVTPDLPWWSAIAIAGGATLLGVAFDAGLGHKDLTAVFATLYVLGCLTAVAVVRRSGVFTAVIQPPLILFFAVPSAYWLLRDVKLSDIKGMVINCGYPLIERFPLMLFTSAAVLLIGLARWYFGAAESEDDSEVSASAALGWLTETAGKLVERVRAALGERAEHATTSRRGRRSSRPGGSGSARGARPGSTRDRRSATGRRSGAERAGRPGSGIDRDDRSGSARDRRDGGSGARSGRPGQSRVRAEQARGGPRSGTPRSRRGERTTDRPERTTRSAPSRSRHTRPSPPDGSELRTDPTRRRPPAARSDDLSPGNRHSRPSADDFVLFSDRRSEPPRRRPTTGATPPGSPTPPPRSRHARPSGDDSDDRYPPRRRSAEGRDVPRDPRPRTRHSGRPADGPDAARRGRREAPGYGSDPNHHPVSRARYRSSGPADAEIPREQRGFRAEDADSWQYDI